MAMATTAKGYSLFGMNLAAATKTGTIEIMTITRIRRILFPQIAMRTVPKTLKVGIRSKNRAGNNTVLLEDTVLLEITSSADRIFVLLLQLRAHSTSTRMLRVIARGRVEIGFVMPISGYNALIDSPTSI